MKEKDVAIVIVDYKSHLNDFEYTSIDRCFDVFRNRDIFVMLPDGISNHEYEYIASLYNKKINYIYNTGGWLSSWEKYCHYCCNPEFYELFSDYEFMMIYQTDCYVFEDNLDYFMGLGYDYYGAPWYQFRKCGNGGFSLRRVDTFIENINKRPDKDVLINSDYIIIEDYLFSIVEDHIEKICPEEIGLEFSLDDWLKEYDPMLKKMPMGCHGWSRDEVRWYWKDKITVKKNPFNTKVLILCMSCNTEKYVKQRELVSENFGKDIDNGKYPGFDYFIFTNGMENYVDYKKKMIYVPCDDSLKGTAEKTIKTLKLVREENIDYDFVILTNTATFFNMKLLYNFFNSGHARSGKVFGGDFQYPILLPPFFRGNFAVFPKNIIYNIMDNYKPLRTENDLDLFSNLLRYKKHYDELLRTFRQVNCCMELKNCDINNINKYFYISLKDYSGDRYANKENILYFKKLCDEKGPYENIEELVGKVKIVTTILGHYKIEKID